MKSVRMTGFVVGLSACLVVFDASTAVGQRRSRERRKTTTLDRVRSQVQSGQWNDAAASLSFITKRESGNAEAWFLYGVALEGGGELLDAIPAYRKGAAGRDFRDRSLYRLALVHAKLQQDDEALNALKDAVKAGFRNYWEYHQAPEFASLREDPRFSELPKVCHYQRARFESEEESGITYTVVTPDDFDLEKTYPVLIAMQPARLEWGLTRLWGDQAKKRGWVVIQPDLVSDGEGDRDRDGDGGRRDRGRRRNGEDYQTAALERNFSGFLDHLEEEFNAEGDKFYLAGCSAGGHAAYAVAMEHPDRFHALVGLPGKPPERTTDVDLLGLKPVLVAHFVGRDDSDGWLDGVRSAHSKLKKLGGQSQLTVLPRDGHIPDSLFGNEFMDHMNEIRQSVLAADATATTAPAS